MVFSTEKCGRTRALLLLLACVLLPFSSAYSQYNKRGNSYNSGDNYHFGYVSGGVGYGSLQTNLTDVDAHGGVGGFAGLGYEFRNGGFWLSMGGQIGFHRSELRFDDYRENVNGYDTQGKAATLHYDVTEKDINEWIFAEVPILLGYYFHGFHVGAGPKIGYAVQSKVRATGDYTVSATNLLYNFEFSDMPEHGYTTYSYNQSGNAKMRPLLSLVGEVSYDVLSSVSTRSRMCNVLKVGFYFEYGLNNLVSAASQSNRLQIDKSDATKVQVNPYLVSGLADSKRIVPFFTGLKITYLIGGSKTAITGGYHKGCHCYN